MTTWRTHFENSGTRRRSQRGMTLPMTALFLVVLFAFASLAIDIGVAYTARTSAQHAADAAALAGAFALLNNTVAPDPVAYAGNEAIAVAAQNRVLGKAVTIADIATPPCPAASASWVCVDTANRRVSVNVALKGTDAVATYFAKVVGWNSINVGTKATAEAAPRASGTYCLKPFYMPSTGGLNKCTGPTVFDSQGNVTPYGKSLIGQQVSLWNNLEPSQWGLLAINGRGGANVRDEIAECVNVDIKCGDTLTTEPGRKVGPVTQGINDLIGSSPDQWQAVGQYIDGGSGMIKDTSKSLATIVVWDCTSPVAKGRNGQVQVSGYAEVFIDGVDKSGATGGINAHLVNFSSCSGSTANGTGPFAVPVRLIQPAD